MVRCCGSRNEHWSVEFDRCWTLVDGRHEIGPVIKAIEAMKSDEKAKAASIREGLNAAGV